MKIRESINQFKWIFLFFPARPASILALAALVLCLYAPPAPAAEGDPTAAVTVGEVTFTPPKGMVAGAGLHGLSGLWRDKTVDEKDVSPLFNYTNSGRHMRFVSTKRGEKNPIQAFKAALGESVNVKDVYSLGDNHGLGIDGGGTAREWIMLTRDGDFFYIWLYYPSTDVKALVEGFTANTPGAEQIVAALKSPRVQSWLNFGVLAPNMRMSGNHAVYEVPDGWSYTEEKDVVRMASPDGKRTAVYEVWPKPGVSPEDCPKLAEKDCKERNGEFYMEFYEGHCSQEDNSAEVVKYNCMPRPLMRRSIHTNLDKKKK